MSENRGRFNYTKNRLIALISQATAELQPEDTHVTGSWDFQTREARSLPLVSVRVSPIDIDDQVYDRIFEGGASIKTGSTAIFNVTIHVHTSACTVAGEDRGRYAQELADKIINYLIGQADDQSSYGIEDIYDLTPREAEMAGYNVARVVISGRMLCKRYD